MSSTIIKEAHKHRIVYLIMQLALLLVIGLCINRQEASAANLSLSVSGPATLNLMPHTTTGDFAKSNDITITASTDGVGYKLIIQAANSTSLTSGVNTIESLGAGTSITESEFANGNYSGKWGYKPSMLNSTANSTFRPSPSTTTGDIINETNCANGTTNCPDNEDTYTISIGAKVDLSQPSGSYENAFNIIIVGNVEYSIIYRNTLVTNMPEDVSGDTDASSVAISSNIPVRDGYTFLGWCTVQVAVGENCTGTSYSAGDIWNLSQNNNSLELYAMWSLSSYTVTVNFAGSGVSSVSFTNDTYGDATTVSTSGGTTSLKHGVSYTITMNFSSSSYTINSWGTTANGTLGSTSANPTTYTVTNTATLTATGKINGYTITYKANGGTGSDYTQIISGTGYLNGNNFTRSNYYFKGWSTSSGTNNTVTHRAGQSIAPSEDLTLYAAWGDSTTTTLYDAVASLNHGRTLDNTSTNGTGLSAKAGIKASTITKDNSGVFTYNSNTFGTSSDAANTKTIYLYRGILDSNLDGTSSTYGSNGNSANYPNYVKLGNTCWRIVRTTGSGGVKMIYNGTWTGSTCANATTSAQVITSAFNNSSASNGYTSLFYNNIHAVGYTYNSAVNGVTSASANTTIAKVFGTSTNNGYTVNSSDSIIKQYIEKTWFTNISAYQSILETNAGYCNDRTLYPSGSYALSNKLAEDTQIVPYGAPDKTVSYFFGAYTRNISAAQAPTLNCPRGTVDIYSVSGASTGNGQLTKPASLLTADELSFAGSGRSTASQGSSYHANSFLRSGSGFWLLSPYSRDSSSGNAMEFSLNSNGSLDDYFVASTLGVRPAISLTSGTTAASGSGTATDPWVVTAP